MSPADSPFASLPASHPDTAELRAYAAGTLPPAEQHRIEAHALDCPRCADLLEGLSLTDAAATDHAVAALRSRLQARLGTAAPRPAATSGAWPRVAAAAALLAVAGGGIWSWQQRETAPPVTTARLETTPPAPASPTRPPDAAVSAAPEAIRTPEVPTTTEYAAVASAQPRQRVLHRTARWGPPARRAVADKEVLSNANTANDAVALAANEASNPTRNEAVATPALAAASVTAAPPAPTGDAALAGTALAADSTALESSAEVDSKERRARSGMAGSPAAPARVRATPMPAAPAIRPAPVGGTPALREYLRRQAAEFAPESNASPLSGPVRIAFVVGADGKVSQLKIIRGLRADYDAEALRIVCEGPAWQPGVAGGRRAPLPMEVTVPF